MAACEGKYIHQMFTILRIVITHFRMLRFLWLIILLFSTGMYAQPVHLRDRPYRDKFHYIDSLERALVKDGGEKERVAAARQMVDWSADCKDEELEAMLRLSAYELRAGLDGEDAAAREKELRDLLEEYGSNKFVRADILQLLGKFYLDVRRRNSHAFEYFLMAYKEYQDFPAEEFPPKTDYLYDLAGAYYRYEDYANAIRYMNEALKTPKEGRLGSGLTLYNTIGLSYKELKKYDSAMLYFGKAYETAAKNNDVVWTGILSGNIGELHYLQKDYPQAIARMEESVSLCLAYNIKRNAVMATCRLAGIYLDLNEVSAAEQCLNRLEPIREGRAFWPEYAVAQRLYAVTARLYAARGNTLMAYKYADSALVSKDSAHAEQTEINRVRAAEKAEYVQHKLELSHVAQEKQRQFLIRNSLIIVIVLVTLLGMLFINRQRLQKKKLAAELDAVTTKLFYSRERAANGEEQAPAIIIREADAAAEAEALSKLENASLLTNEQWEEFRKLFDKVHKGFLSNLKRKLPDLSQTDIRFIALTKLKLSSREMASMLGVSPSTIRIYKFRLRKKLGLDKEGDIEDLINKL